MEDRRHKRMEKNAADKSPRAAVSTRALPQAQELLRCMRRSCSTRSREFNEKAAWPSVLNYSLESKPVTCQTFHNTRSKKTDSEVYRESSLGRTRELQKGSCAHDTCQANLLHPHHLRHCLDDAPGELAIRTSKKLQQLDSLLSTRRITPGS